MFPFEACPVVTLQRPPASGAGLRDTAVDPEVDPGISVLPLTSAATLTAT